MADSKPNPQMIDNLDLLLDMELIKDENDWKLLRDWDETPPAKAIEHSMKKDDSHEP